MKTWKVPVYWNMTGTVEVTANTMEEAIDTVNCKEIALPAGKYMDGSFMADDGDIEMIRQCYNNGQADEDPEHCCQEQNSEDLGKDYAKYLHNQAEKANSVPVYRPEVTEVCPHCDSEITVVWNPEEDGYQIHCPRCGAKMMLCSMCPMQEACDWYRDTKGKEHCSMMEKRFKVEIIRTSLKTVFIKARTPEEAEAKGHEFCDNVDFDYDDENMSVTVDSDYTGYPYTDAEIVD